MAKQKKGREVDARKHTDSSPAYLRCLISCGGLTQNEVANRIGVSHRMMRYYLALNPADWRPAPYHVQVAIEALVDRSNQEESWIAVIP
jgi:hypothetical protein